MAFLFLAALLLQTTQVPAKPLPERVAAVETSLQSLWKRVFNLDLNRLPQLDCNSGNYLEASPENSTMVFPVSCEKVEPYLEGFRITIAIGNPYAMRYPSVEGELFNGKDLLTVDLEKGTAFTITLNPGVWNKVIVTLNPVSAADVRLVLMSFKVKTAESK